MYWVGFFDLKSIMGSSSNLEGGNIETEFH
jgi:hypothetical protein